MKMEMTEKTMKKSIYCQVGLEGLIEAVAGSSTIPNRVFLPYNLAVFWRMFRDSKDLQELDEKHNDKYQHSKIFRMLKPSYREMRSMLAEKYGVL